MAFLKFSRDKRGVENFYLVHQTTNRRGKVRPRVLYWFRTPPDVKVGRQPFDPAVRRVLESQNPDVHFDWRAIVETPIPSADADKWRERRRAERAAKHAAAAEEAAEAANAEPDAGESENGTPDDAASANTVIAVAAAAATNTSPSASPDAPRPSDPSRKRRRRRRGGGGRSSTGPGTGGGVTPAGGSAPAPPSGGDRSED